MIQSSDNTEFKIHRHMNSKKEDNMIGTDKQYAEAQSHYDNLTPEEDLTGEDYIECELIDDKMCSGCLRCRELD